MLRLNDRLPNGDAMKRRNLFRTVALAILSNAAPRLAKAQPNSRVGTIVKLSLRSRRLCCLLRLVAIGAPGRSTRLKDGWTSTMLAFR